MVMSIASTAGVLASAAGGHLSQATAADADRMLHETDGVQRRLTADRSAQRAAGVAQTDGHDHATTDRDPDGRRAWEVVPQEADSQAPGGARVKPSVPAPAEHRGQAIDLTA
jgi:hypothetical protein